MNAVAIHPIWPVSKYRDVTTRRTTAILWDARYYSGGKSLWPIARWPSWNSGAP